MGHCGLPFARSANSPVLLLRHGRLLTGARIGEEVKRYAVENAQEDSERRLARLAGATIANSYIYPGC